MAQIIKIIEETLSAGATTLTVTNAAIPYSIIAVNCDKYGTYPANMTVSGTTLTLAYEAQTEDLHLAISLIKADLAVIDGLTSDSQTDALSAKQGKVLKDELDLKADESQIPVSLSELGDDNTHRVVTDTQISDWNGAVNNIQYYEQKSYLSKNLFELDIDTETVPSNITYVNNGDGTVTVSSTAASGARYLILGSYTVKANQTIKLVGCPSGGGSTSHRLVLTYSGSALVSDNGNGVTYTNYSGSDMTVEVSVRIAGNYVSSNLLFKPMISTDTDITYSDFMQYAPSNTDLLNIIKSLPEGGGVNYVATETAIGTYLGETLYRQIFTGLNISLNTNAWTTLSGINIPNGKDLVNAVCYGIYASQYIINCTKVHLNSADGTIEVRNIESSTTLTAIMLEYTKSS